MKSLTIFPFALVLFLLLSGSQPCLAQTENGHVYEDSSLLYPQEDVASPSVQVDEETENSGSSSTLYEKYIDTSLVKNDHEFIGDSMEVLRNSQTFAYARNLDSMLIAQAKKQQQPKKEEGDSSLLIKILTSRLTLYLLWLIAIVFVGYVVYNLFLSEGFLRRASAKSKIIEQEEEEEMPADAASFESKIQAAVRDKNYRLATRYLYLQLLQKLNAAGMISFAADKTNSEYLAELTGNAVKPGVVEASRYYDYVWYGEFSVDQLQFGKIEKAFRSINI